jgi:Bacterial mobilisation protein (MobC)
VTKDCRQPPDPPSPASSANCPTTVGGASKSLRPSYGRPQAQAPAEGGGGGPAGAPDHGAVVAEGGHDQGPWAAGSSAATGSARSSIRRASAAAAARRKPKRRQRNAVHQKQCRVTARFDEDEKRQLIEQAAAAGLTLAHLVARRALAPETGTTPAEDQLDAAIDELAATRSELSAWGNNLNQIARQLNMGAALPPGPAAAFLTAAKRLLHQDLPAAADRLDEAAHRVAHRRARR